MNEFWTSQAAIWFRSGLDTHEIMKRLDKCGQRETEAKIYKRLAEMRESQRKAMQDREPLKRAVNK